MQGSVTVFMAAPAERIWELVADVRNTGKFSPETFEAEWLDGATGPALGARFRGHVRRNEVGPVYWTTCRVTACEPGREFGFEVLVGDRAVNNWHYRLASSDGGTDVTESFRLEGNPLTALYSVLGGQLRRRRNLRDMRKTLERIKVVVEDDAQHR
ncbi:Polyketide cyclase / dehydrase and lipid transport [Mycolicibacterium chubuense NBB4]|uniref:Polyketide cyclase / dehydrase and lipid transport n=1 Tax=Mycolicibacterium chubuense (strain NBB4) TaxID=710421 RepID=I4BK09_MYCCN|nr:SRPBCC family protein [Mycolicibacterium chubuense]AFM17616.1 Polyketide cyclase / dehydrase and lipid transport [Mycolicibacterium chubuense NBB4]